MPTTLSREHYLSKNICPTCKCRELKVGYKCCEICKAATDKWMKENRVRKDIYNKERYEMLKRQGLCVSCKVPTGGNVFCPVCTSKICARRAYYRGLHSRNRWSKR